MAKKKGVDLYRCYRQYERRTFGRGLRRNSFFPVAVTALLCLLVWQLLVFQNRSLERKLAELQAWLDDPENVSSYEEAAAKDLLLAHLAQETVSVQTLTARLTAYPRVDGQLLERIAAVSDGGITVSVSGYDSETGELRCRAESPVVTGAMTCARELEALGLFQDVSYSGYAFEGGVYTFQLTCTLRASGGEETRNAAGTND